jgi:type II secretory pathway pseudopilin PulG
MRVINRLVDRMACSERAQREDGAVVVIVAMMMVVFLGGAALSVDLGDAWQEKRQLHTATDAAALSAAEVFAFKGDGCISVAGSFLEENDAESSQASCTPGVGLATASGYVTVEATKPQSWRFTDSPGGDLWSQTSAEWGLPGSAQGMRPFALCQEYPAFNEWMNNPIGPASTSASIQIPFTKEGLGCGQSPGNWAFLDYNETSGGAEDLKDWFANGYPEPVEFPSLIGAQTGHVSSLQSTLDSLQGNGTVFPIAVYDLVAGEGNQTSYHAVGVVKVKLIDFSITGSQSNQYMTFQFVPGFLTGTCCGTGPDTGARVVNICAVNDDPESGECGQ